MTTLCPHTMSSLRLCRLLHTVYWTKTSRAARVLSIPRYSSNQQRISSLNGGKETVRIRIYSRIAHTDFNSVPATGSYLALWAINAIYQAFVCLGTSYLVVRLQATSSEGRVSGLDEAGLYLYTSILIAVALQVG